jgi:hypothetical protein
MPQWAKRDEVGTRTARNSKEFVDRRSWKGWHKDGTPHIRLYGRDKERRHDEIKARGWCELKITPQCKVLNGQRGAHWHHDPPLGKGGDDSLEGGKWACVPCHSAAHRREVGISRPGEAA